MAFPLCLFALLVSLVTHAVPVASAHSYLVRAEPSAGQLLVEAPRVIQLWFSEEPEPRFSQVQLFTSGGSVVQTVPMSVAPEDPRLAVIRLAPLPNGIYTVSWRAVSVVDGHTTAGNFPIGVGIGPETANLASATASDAPSPVATMPQTAIRSLAYLSTSLVAGAIAFGSLVLGPAWARRQAWL
ncbi:MAG: copper resistance protein CopC, partial [Chloroflexi bacterium]|nr:copper resistance protein CopC [Chloroflexota bacterium]